LSFQKTQKMHNEVDMMIDEYISNNINGKYKFDGGIEVNINNNGEVLVMNPNGLNDVILFFYKLFRKKISVWQLIY